MRRMKCYGRVKTTNVETSFKKKFFDEALNTACSSDNYGVFKTPSSDTSEYLTTESEEYSTAKSSENLPADNSILFHSDNEDKLFVPKFKTPIEQKTVEFTRKKTKKKKEKRRKKSEAFNQQQPCWAEIEQHTLKVENAHQIPKDVLSIDNTENYDSLTKHRYKTSKRKGLTDSAVECKKNQNLQQQKKCEIIETLGTDHDARLSYSKKLISYKHAKENISYVGNISETALFSQNTCDKSEREFRHITTKERQYKKNSFKSKVERCVENIEHNAASEEPLLDKMDVSKSASYSSGDEQTTNRQDKTILYSPGEIFGKDRGTISTPDTCSKKDNRMCRNSVLGLDLELDNYSKMFGGIGTSTPYNQLILKEPDNLSISIRQSSNYFSTNVLPSKRANWLTSTPARQEFGKFDLADLSIISQHISTPRAIRKMINVNKQSICTKDSYAFDASMNSKRLEQTENHRRYESISRSVFHPSTRYTSETPSKVSRSVFKKTTSIVSSVLDPQFQVNTSKLIELCGQEAVVLLQDGYSWGDYKIQKLGEGTYGEVFMLKAIKKKDNSVVKIIPVSDETGRNTQSIESVYSEIKVAECLSNLRNNSENSTSNFNKIKSVHFAQGKYPEELIKAWDDFSTKRSTYNERPAIYDENQLYVMLELDYGGKDLSKFVLKNAVEAKSVFDQVALSLAIAEEALSFEHRDLHLGNLLVERTNRKSISYILRGQSLTLPTRGVIVAIIDFTLSRVLDESGCVFYNNLANDESLFNQTGDIQFEVYKATKFHLENQWQECLLFSNVLWLLFLCEKLEKFKYSRPTGAKHLENLRSVLHCKELLKSCKSALEAVTHCSIISSLPVRKQGSKRNTSSVRYIERKSLQISSKF